MNFDRYFQQYEDLVQQANAVFDKLKNEYGDCVKCKLACSDCCYALFDLTLVEALYINTRVNELFEGEAREVLMERANKADRKIYKLKRQAFKDHEAGKSEDDILKEMAEQRVRCPALNDDNRCSIYDVRPITCRIYGVPTVIGGKAHTCGLSGFQQGQQYPTVKLDDIYNRLYEISFALAQEIKSKYPKLAEMLVPLSMALVTDYTEDYLGVMGDKSSAEEA